MQGRAVSEPVRDQRRSSRPASGRCAFDPALFDYGKNKLDLAELRDLGFNGFRVHYPINKPALQGRGRSCSRARATSAPLGKGQNYGLSARGLAVDTAAPAGEEFPRFVEFWVERPRANATSLTIYALLDSRASPAPTASSSPRASRRRCR